MAHYYASGRQGVESALRGAVQAANLAVIGAAVQPGYGGMATTLDALVLTPVAVYLAHIGDGRVYKSRGEELRRLTQDHSEVAELVRLRLVAPDQVRAHPKRAALTRTIGGGLIARPDLLREPIAAGDRYLLCSDGLWGAIDEREIAEALRDPDPQSSCATLVEIALTRGADDNVTAQVVDVRAVGVPSGAAITAGESAGVLRRIASRLIG